MKSSESKIAYITEAFSIQPKTLIVGEYYRPHGLSIDDQVKIACIKLEMIYRLGDPFPYYRGYDEDGNVLFEYMQESVNVGYLPEPPKQ